VLSRWPALRWGGLMAISAAGAAALWWVLSVLLSSDRGLDITDEGLYLMAADPPSLDSQWGFPWGWHTGPLLRFVGYDLASFRTLGAVILVLAGGWLGWSAVRCAGQLHVALGQPVRWTWGFAVCGAVVGAIGSLLYYHGLLRTPSYNWVNLVGILLTAAALASLVEVLSRQTSRSASLRAYALCLVAGLGLFVTLPVKPSTFPLVLAAGVALIGLTIGWGPALRASLTIVTTVLGLVALAVLTGLWPRNFVEVLARALEAPKGFDQTLAGAVENLLILPVEFEFRALEGRPLLLVAMVIVGLAILGILVYRRVRSVAARGVGYSLVVIGAFGLLAVQFWTYADRYPQELLILRPIVTASLMLVAATAGVAASGPRQSAQDLDGVRRLRQWPLIVFLLCVPFIFGFGSSHGAYGMAAAAAGVFFVSALVLAVRIRPRALQGAVAVSIVLLTLATTAGSIAQSDVRPFRIAPILDNRVALSVTSSGSSLLVDEDLAAVVSSLRQQASAHGWAPGTAMVGLAWKHAAGIPLLLGARLPKTLMTALMGWTGSGDLTEFNAGQDASDYPYGEAWLLTSATRTLRPEARVEVSANHARLDGVAARTFPAGYECVAAAGTFLLWKPRVAGSKGPDDVLQAEASCPAPVPADSAYDAENGWFPQPSA
jgi:hypothetical protein